MVITKRSVEIIENYFNPNNNYLGYEYYPNIVNFYNWVRFHGKKNYKIVEKLQIKKDKVLVSKNLWFEVKHINDSFLVCDEKTEIHIHPPIVDPDTFEYYVLMRVYNFNFIQFDNTITTEFKTIRIKIQEFIDTFEIPVYPSLQEKIKLI